MIAAVLTKPGSMELKDVPSPPVKDGEVKIRVQGCGICASSIPLWEGREWFSYPSEPGSPGHEGWGIVEATGEKAEGINRGDRVAFLSFHAYAQYDTASIHSVVRLPPALDDRPFPGEPLGCAMNIFERSDVNPGDTIVVIGTGFLGVLLCQLAVHTRAKVIAVSRRKHSLDMAAKVGVHETVAMTRIWETMHRVAEIAGDAPVTRVIEATGKQEALDLATEIVSEGGKIIVAGYHQDGLRQVNFQKWNWKGIDVINAHERAQAKYLEGMRKAIEAVVAGILRPEMLYSDILPLSQINRGFELTAKRPKGFMKALIQV